MHLKLDRVRASLSLGFGVWLIRPHMLVIQVLHFVDHEIDVQHIVWFVIPFLSKVQKIPKQMQVQTKNKCKIRAINLKC